MKPQTMNYTRPQSFPWAVVLMLSMFLPVQATASTFTVSPGIDAPDAAPGDGVCATPDGECSLRAAVEEAAAQYRPVTILLEPGRYELDEPLTLPAALTLRGTNPGEVHVVASEAFAGEHLLTFRRQSNEDRQWRNLSHLTLDGGGRTGVVANDAPLRISEVVIRGGKTGEDGGGITATGPLAIIRSSIIDNDAGKARGGALLIQEAPAWITQSTLTGNSAIRGGGIFARDAKVLLESSTLMGNTGGPVGGYQQNPGAALTMFGTLLAGTSMPSGGIGLDCRSSSRSELPITSHGYNLMAVTGPTGQTLEGGTWRNSWEHACNPVHPKDRSGTRDTPLDGMWNRVTSPTGLVSIEVAPEHPAYRAIPGEQCPPADAWGRPTPPEEACDIGALRSNAVGSPENDQPSLAEAPDRAEPSSSVASSATRSSAQWLFPILLLLVVALALLLRRRSR